jgi:di/tricarboxylate transporter
MSFEMIVVFGLVVLAMGLFISERLSFDMVALLVMSILMLSGILTPREGLSGFSNPATITIAAMFVISDGIKKTGALESIGNYFSRLGRYNYWTALAVMMLIIAVISAFINNTSAVVIFIPIIMSTAAKMKVSPSKLLMPLSFASMFGGVCTLVGTSTNILVSSIAESRGLEPFTMFEFTRLGIIFLAAGFIFMFAIGIRLIPARRKETSLTESFNMNEYLTDIVLKKGFKHLGKKIDEIKKDWDLDLEVVRVFRKGESTASRESEMVEVGDVLRIRGNPKEIDKLLETEDISIKPAENWEDANLKEGNYALVEGVIAPDSSLESRKIKDIDFARKYGAVVLGVRKKGEVLQKEIEEVRLSGGDSLLLTVHYDQLQHIKNEPSFVMVSDIEVFIKRRKKMPVAVLILAAVIGLAALKLVPLVSAAVGGVVLMVLTRCITAAEVYRAINWKIIFLLGGVIPLGIAMDRSGAADLISKGILNVAGDMGPHAVLAGFFLVTMILTEMISNQATAALLAPIAIQAAHTLNVNPHPFLLGITFAASLSFMTPIGYQTNTLVYGPGHYKFTDYTRVGIWLNILFWTISTLMIPILWEF